MMTHDTRAQWVKQNTSPAHIHLRISTLQCTFYINSLTVLGAEGFTCKVIDFANR